MRTQIAWLAGYCSVLLLPTLVVVGVSIGHPSLAFAFTVLVLPLGRMLLGGLDNGRPPLWSESVATCLHVLPMVYASVLLCVMAWVVAQLASGTWAWEDLLALGASLWAMLIFSTCVAHELLHRVQQPGGAVGAVVAGLAGYPLLVIEHRQHHSRYGSAPTEWPRIDESSLHFAFCRLSQVVRDTGQAATSGFSGSTIASLRGFWIASGTSALLLGLFAVAGGWRGAVLYASVGVGVAIGVQLITYLQHWGLGNDSIEDGEQRQWSWEDDCILQAFMTLHITFHQGHHDAPRRPFYRIGLAPGSPRLPAGYLLLLFLSLVPPLWRMAMMPVLAAWKRSPYATIRGGRRLTCFTLYAALDPAASLVRSKS